MGDGRRSEAMDCVVASCLVWLMMKKSIIMDLTGKTL